MGRWIRGNLIHVTAPQKLSNYSRISHDNSAEMVTARYPTIQTFIEVQKRQSAQFLPGHKACLLQFVQCTTRSGTQQKNQCVLVPTLNKNMTQSFILVYTRGKSGAGVCGSCASPSVPSCAAEKCSIFTSLGLWTSSKVACGCKKTIILFLKDYVKLYL